MRVMITTDDKPVSAFSATDVSAAWQVHFLCGVGLKDPVLAKGIIM
jgi:uncharacterized protein YgfB (UPF0149 family)